MTATSSLVSMARPASRISSGDPRISAIGAPSARRARPARDGFFSATVPPAAKPNDSTKRVHPEGHACVARTTPWVPGPARGLYQSVRVLVSFGSQLGGGARSLDAFGPSNSVRIGFSASAQKSTALCGQVELITVMPSSKVPSGLASLSLTSQRIERPSASLAAASIDLADHRDDREPAVIARKIAVRMILAFGAFSWQVSTIPDAADDVADFFRRGRPVAEIVGAGEDDDHLRVDAVEFAIGDPPEHCSMLSAPSRSCRRCSRGSSWSSSRATPSTADASAPAAGDGVTEEIEVDVALLGLREQLLVGGVGIPSARGTATVAEAGGGPWAASGSMDARSVRGSQGSAKAAWGFGHTGISRGFRAPSTRASRRP